MNDKSQKLKKQLKSRFPEILVGTIVIAGVIAVIYLAKSQPKEILLSLTNDEWAKVVSGDVAKLATDIGTLLVVKEYHK